MLSRIIIFPSYTFFDPDLYSEEDIFTLLKAVFRDYGTTDEDLVSDILKLVIVILIHLVIHSELIVFLSLIVDPGLHCDVGFLGQGKSS